MLQMQQFGLSKLEEVGNIYSLNSPLIDSRKGKDINSCPSLILCLENCVAMFKTKGADAAPFDLFLSQLANENFLDLFLKSLMHSFKINCFSFASRF